MSLEQYKDKTRQELLVIMDIQAEEYQRLLSDSDKSIAELEKERDDLQAYKALSIELANRKGYDSLASVFDGWEPHNLRQQAKGLEDYVSNFMDNNYILHLDVSNDYHSLLINLNATALRLNKQAELKEQGE